MITSNIRNIIKDYVHAYVSEYTLCKPQYYDIHFHPVNLTVGRISSQYLQGVRMYLASIIFVQKFAAIKFYYTYISSARYVFSVNRRIRCRLPRF